MRISDWSSDVCSSDLDIPPLLAMFGLGGGEPVVHKHSRCQGISGVGIGCEHLIYAFARSFQIVLAWMDTQLGILQQTGIAGRQIIAILPPLMRRDGAKAPDQIGKRDLQRGPDVIFLTGKPDIARPKTTICPIIPQGKVKVLSLRTRT